MLFEDVAVPGQGPIGALTRTYQRLSKTSAVPLQGHSSAFQELSSSFTNFTISGPENCRVFRCTCPPVPLQGPSSAFQGPRSALQGLSSASTRTKRCLCKDLAVPFQGLSSAVARTYQYLYKDLAVPFKDIAMPSEGLRSAFTRT